MSYINNLKFIFLKEIIKMKDNENYTKLSKLQNVWKCGIENTVETKIQHSNEKKNHNRPPTINQRDIMIINYNNYNIYNIIIINNINNKSRRFRA